MTKIQYKEKAVKAYELGKAAFHANKKCIPAADRDFLKLLENTEFGTSVHIARAWMAGYTIENLNTPI